MGAPYATVDDVEDRYESVIPQHRRQWVQTLLNEAIGTLDGQLPSLRARFDTGQVDPVLVRKVVVDAVLWVVRPQAQDRDQGDLLAAEVPSRQRPATNPNVISYSQADLNLLAPPDANVPVGSARLAVPRWGPR